MLNQPLMCICPFHRLWAQRNLPRHRMNQTTLIRIPESVDFLVVAAIVRLVAVQGMNRRVAPYSA